MEQYYEALSDAVKRGDIAVFHQVTRSMPREVLNELLPLVRTDAPIDSPMRDCVEQMRYDMMSPFHIQSIIFRSLQRGRFDEIRYIARFVPEETIRACLEGYMRVISRA